VITENDLKRLQSLVEAARSGETQDRRIADKLGRSYARESGPIEADIGQCSHHELVDSAPSSGLVREDGILVEVPSRAASLPSRSPS